MTEAAFLSVLEHAAEVTGLYDVVSVIVPSRDGLPERSLFAHVVEQYKRPEVKAVVLHKAEEAA